MLVGGAGNGKDTYRRAVELDSPGTVPCLVSERLDLAWIEETDSGKVARIRELQALFPDDLLDTGDCWMDSPINHRSRRGRWRDEWGVEWSNQGYGSKVAGHPLEDGLDEADAAGGSDAAGGFAFPDTDRPDRFLRADPLLERRGGRYCRARVWFTLFERLWMLRGFTNLLLEPYTDEVGFRRLRDRVTEIDLAVIDRWLERGVDAVFFSDDWGSQNALLIDPQDWRRLYKPSYEKLFRRVRDGGAHVWMHLCGNIRAILPDLVDLGLNVLNPVQPQALDIRSLGRDFRGRICFNGGIDVQGTMVRGTPEEVKREVRETVALLSTGRGGYIGGMSHSIMPETPLDNIIAVYEAFAEYL